MACENIIVFCPREIVSLEPRLQGIDDAEMGFPFAEDAIEDMVVCLASIETNWSAGDFRKMKVRLKSLSDLADRTGLPDVAHVARIASGLVGGPDDVALAAVIARLVRVGETSLAALLDISYRQS